MFVISYPCMTCGAIRLQVLVKSGGLFVWKCFVCNAEKSTNIPVKEIAP